MHESLNKEGFDALDNNFQSHCDCLSFLPGLETLTKTGFSFFLFTSSYEFWGSSALQKDKKYHSSLKVHK